jgi:hypothetical protein
MPSTATKIAMPGKTDIHQFLLEKGLRVADEKAEAHPCLIA